MSHLTQFQTKLCIIRSDNGWEFHIPTFYSSKGIIHHHSCIETPQKNGVVEHKHKHLLQVACALKFPSGISIKYRNECVLIAIYLINKITTPLLQNRSPYELLFQSKTMYKHLRIFGSLTYASILTNARKKFDPHSQPCIFIWYCFGVKCYKLLNINTRYVFLSHHVLLMSIFFL